MSVEVEVEDAAAPCAYNETSAQVGSTNITVLINELSSDATTGLTSAQVAIRHKQYGRNVLETPRGKSLIQLILEQFDDKLVQILLAVALISGIFSFLEMKAHTAATGEAQNILKSFIEPIIILAILVLNAGVGVWQSQQAEGSLEALKKLQPSLATVLRDGEWIDNVDAGDLVPGDIIHLRVGDKVSADARVLSLESSILSLDEGSLTGESMTVQKLPRDEGLCGVGAPVQDMRGMIFSGTVCTSGSAIAMVSSTV